MLEAHNIDRSHNKDIVAMAEKNKDLNKRAILLVALAAAVDNTVAAAVDKILAAATVAAADKAGYNNNLALF